MSFLPTKSGSDIFEPLDGAGNARGPVMGEMQTWTEEVEQFLDGLATFNSNRSTITTSTTISDSHHGKTLRCSGAGIVITVPAAASLTDSGHVTWITNPQITTAVKIVSASSTFSTFWLFPYQTLKIYKDGSIVIADRPIAWRPPTGQATFYCASSGTDDANNDGLSASRPISIQEAINRVEFYVFHNGAASKIKLAPGTYTEVNLVHTFRVTGYHVIYIEGDDLTDPSTTIIQVASSNVGLTVRDYSGVVLRAVSFVSSGTASVGISSSQTGIIDIWDIHWGAFPGGFHIESTNGGSVGYVIGSILNRITGSTTFHWRIAARSSFICTSVTIDVDGSLTMTDFLSCSLVSSAVLANVTFTGSGAGSGLTGRKYVASQNAVISGIGSVTLPGATAGTTTTGGQAS